jgi:tetratricopeptide (TPR) repeat protein
MKNLLFILIFCGLVLADSSQEAQNLYNQGQFLAAAKMFSGLNTAKNTASAARAYSIYALTQPENQREKIYIQAESLAKKAIDQDANLADGYFELARAIGQLGVLRGIGVAIVQGTGSKIKQLFDQTLELQPNHAGAMVGLAVWHAEITARGSLAALTMGADANQIETLFRQALQLAPNNIGFRLEYAKTYLTLNKPQQAREQLQWALRIAAKDAEDRLYQEQVKFELQRL